MNHCGRSIAAALLIAVSSAIAADPAAASKEIGLNVAEFCKQHLGEQVGNGQCAVLAGQALKASGAKGRSADNPQQGDYVWGDLALLIEVAPDFPKLTGGKITDVRPGDVIQFRDVKFAGKQGPHRTYTATREHHTAVVAMVDSGVISVYEQNVNGKLTVTLSKLRIADMKAGWMRVYHPVKK